MTEISAGRMTTGSITWAVTFDDSSHMFTGRSDGMPEVNAVSWADLESNAKVRASQARIRVEVPYAYIGFDGVRGAPRSVIKHGTATGRHAANGNVLATEDGKPVQFSPYRTNQITPPSQEDGQRMAELTDKIRELETDRRFLTTKYVFPEGDLGRQVQHEIEQARKAEDHG